MKKMFLAFALLLVATTMQAQDAESTPAPQATQVASPRYGLIRYDSLLHAMPEYGAMQIRLQQLREKYEDEATYNEAEFKRQFTDYLQGQKDFPQNILLKRQRDLQEAMEKGLAFRHDADSLLRCAATDMERPVRQLLDAAIAAVGRERGYELIVNGDSRAFPFVNPTLAEDATPFVTEELIALRRSGL